MFFLFENICKKNISRKNSETSLVKPRLIVSLIEAREVAKEQQQQQQQCSHMSRCKYAVIFRCTQSSTFLTRYITNSLLFEYLNPFWQKAETEKLEAITKRLEDTNEEHLNYILNTSPITLFCNSFALHFDQSLDDVYAAAFFVIMPV